MPTGHEFGSNYNIGIIDVTDKAYPELIKGILKAHNRVLEIHAGNKEPTKQFPKGGKETNYIE